jgi:hypothetical protein
LNDKKVLTVAASGDHPFNMILGGAKSVTNFDINKAAYYWLELKKAGVETLDLNRFKKAFFGTIGGREYAEMRNALHPELQKFWDEMVETYEISPVASLDRSIFRGPKDVGVKHYERANNYLCESGFSELKQKLRKTPMEFVHGKLYDLSKAGVEYDAVFTSNICDWADKETYIKFVKNDMGKMLTPNGVAQVTYERSDTANWCAFYEDEDLWKNIFKGEKFKNHHFKSLTHANENGLVISMTK